MSYGVCHRRDVDPVLLWVWLWPAATTLIRLLVWEHPYASGAALKRKKKKKKKERKKYKSLDPNPTASDLGGLGSG